jgi:hypothetical protein
MKKHGGPGVISEKKRESKDAKELRILKRE